MRLLTAYRMLKSSTTIHVDSRLLFHLLSHTTLGGILLQKPPYPSLFAFQRNWPGVFIEYPVTGHHHSRGYPLTFRLDARALGGATVATVGGSRWFLRAERCCCFFFLLQVTLFHDNLRGPSVSGGTANDMLELVWWPSADDMRPSVQFVAAVTDSNGITEYSPFPTLVIMQELYVHLPVDILTRAVVWMQADAIYVTQEGEFVTEWRDRRAKWEAYKVSSVALRLSQHWF